MVVHDSDENFKISDHPTICITAAIYHLERRGGLTTIKNIRDELTPLLSWDEVRATLEDLVMFGAVVRNMRDVARKGQVPDCVLVFLTGPYNHGMARGMYEKYWSDIVFERLEVKNEDEV